MSSFPDWSTPPKAAKVLRVDPETIRELIRSGELRASNLASRSATRPRWRISREALEEFLAGREPRPPAKKKRRSNARIIQFF